MDTGDLIAVLALAVAGGSLWVAVLAYRKTVFQKAWTSKLADDGALLVMNRTNELALDVEVLWYAAQSRCGSAKSPSTTR